MLRLTLIGALAGLLSCGCDKSSAPVAERAVPYSLTSQGIAHLHWLGKKRLAADTNAASLMRIWAEPESAAVENQTLAKLSTAPWRLLPHVATTNAAAAPLLRELLDDCVQQESYLEIRAATNQPGEIAFAIKLPADRAGLWQTNLAAVLESLTGLQTEPTEKGWRLKKHDAPNLFELTRVGDWVVVGLGQDQNALFGDFTARILRDQTPLAAAANDSWLEGEIELPRLAQAFQLDWQLPGSLSKIAFKTAGDGKLMQTRGTVDFSQPLALTLEPWSFPTNLLRYPLASFTAVRGAAGLLAGWQTWQHLQAGPLPNQFFLWASLDVPMGSYAAAPVADVTNWIAGLGGALGREYGPWLATNNCGNLQINPETHSLEWKTVPFATPFLEPQRGFAFAGMFLNAGLKLPMPAELLLALQPTNLVYYDWEITGPRILSAMRVAQFSRFILHQSQLAPSPSMSWLLANSSNSIPCITVVSQVSPQQFSFVRQSGGVGLTGMELQLVADWLEAPHFPRGLTSFEPAPQRRRPSGRSPVSGPSTTPPPNSSPNP